MLSQVAHNKRVHGIVASLLPVTRALATRMNPRSTYSIKFKKKTISTLMTKRNSLVLENEKKIKGVRECKRMLGIT